MISSIHALYRHPSVDNVDFTVKIMDKLYVSPIHLSLVLRRVRESRLFRKTLNYHRRMTSNDLEAIIIAKLDNDDCAKLENDMFTIVPSPDPANLPQEAEILHVCIDIEDTASSA